MGPYVFRGCKAAPLLNSEPSTVEPQFFMDTDAYGLPKMIPPSLPNPVMKVIEWKQLSHHNMQRMLPASPKLSEWFTMPLDVSLDANDPLNELEEIGNRLEKEAMTFVRKNARIVERGLVLGIESLLSKMVVLVLLEIKNPSAFSSKWNQLLSLGDKLISSSNGSLACQHLVTIVHWLSAMICLHLGERQNFSKWNQLSLKHFNASEELMPLMELIEMYPVFWNNQLQRDSKHPKQFELVLPGRLSSRKPELFNWCSWWNISELQSLPRGRAYKLPVASHNQDICSIINLCGWLLFDIVKEHGCNTKVNELVFLL